MFGSKSRLRRIEAKLVHVECTLEHINQLILTLLGGNMGKVEDAIAALQAQAGKNVNTEGAAVVKLQTPVPNNDEANAAAIDAVVASLAASEVGLANAVNPAPEPTPEPAPQS